MRRGMHRDAGVAVVSDMGQKYIVKERRYYASDYYGVLSRIRFPYPPAEIGGALNNLAWHKDFCANTLHVACDLWIEPVRDDAFVIEVYDFGQWMAEEYFEDYHDALFHYEGRREQSNEWRLVYADGSEIETTAYDAYEAWRDHVRTESDILARRSRTW